MAIYLRGAKLHERQPEWTDSFPFSLPWLRDLELEFRSAVTFFVGENGSGKSTLIEGLAGLMGLPVAGGGRADLGSSFAPDAQAALAGLLRPIREKRPQDSYFFRAEHQAHYAALLEARRQDPDFIGDPYQSYGGKPLARRSHGEAFMELMQNRMHSGLFLMDEPESALSPARQLALLAMMRDRVDNGHSQFIIATHSPILMTYPGAEILSLDDESLTRVPLEETDHYLITRGVLEHPDRYWQHL